MKLELICPRCATPLSSSGIDSGAAPRCSACGSIYPVTGDVLMLVPNVGAYSRVCIKAAERELQEFRELDAPWASVLAERVESYRHLLAPFVSDDQEENLGRGDEYLSELTLNRMVRYIYGPYTSRKEGICEALYATIVRLGAGLPDDALVLDVGCGLGRLVMEYATLLPYGEVIGLDIAFPSLVTARTLVRGSGEHRFFFRRMDAETYVGEGVLPAFNLSNAQFVAADILSPCMAEGQFDCIVSTNTVNLTPNPAATLTRMIALLKSRGRLIVGDLFGWRLETPPNRRRFPNRAKMVEFLLQSGLDVQQDFGALPYTEYWNEERSHVWGAHVIVAEKP